MICFRNASLPLLFLLVHSFTPAQVVPSGTEIIGTVKDSTGAVVPKVGVQLLSRDGKRIASTSANNEGAFHFSIPKAGEFVVQVRHKGFKTFVAHVPASPGRVKPIAVVLELTRIVWALSISPLFRTILRDVLIRSPGNRGRRTLSIGKRRSAAQARHCRDRGKESVCLGSICIDSAPEPREPWEKII